MKKRILCLLLAGAMAVSVFGCNGGGDVEATTTEGATTTTTEAATTTEAGPAPVEIAKSVYGNPIGGFNAEDVLTYGGDPSVLIDGDTVYLYTGRDTAKGSSYVIPDYQCYSTKDLINWTYEGVVLKMSDVKWADNNSAWAGQVAMHYDKAVGKNMYYFYYCSWDNTDSGKQSIGVAISDSPTGTFVDIGKAIVKGSFTTDETSAWNDIDPTVWIETDEKGEEHRYLCWGNSKLYMCELNEDMISIKDYNGDGQITFGKDVVSQLMPASFTEAPWLYRRQDENGKCYGDYYLFYAYGWREHMAYATTDDLMKGNWTFGDVIMDPSVTSNTNHMAVFDFKGKTYFVYHNGSLPNGSGFRRVACIEELTFYSDGAVEYIDETAIGISGTASALTTVRGEVLAHAKFNNSASDNKYPYIDVQLGSNLKGISEADTQWEIVPGKSDEANAYYVSIESNNKPGLYITAGEGTAVISQDHNGKMAEAQTFKTVMGLSGDGVSFESVAFPGMYLTLSGGAASLTDGSDKEACSFLIK